MAVQAIDIMFVDDEPEVLDGLRRTLHQARPEWVPKFFAGAEAAFEAVRSSSSVLLVTDWMMPGMSGIGLCGALTGSAEAAGSDYYVIVLTGRQERSAVVEALGRGADDFVTKPFDTPELTARIETGLRALRLRAELRAANRRLQSLATTDDLTGLDNRRRGADVLRAEMERVRRGLQGLGVMLVDVDHFKRINDLHGHAAGDLTLVEIARRLRSAVRAYDTVVRWGGEEFLVVCPGAAADEVHGIAVRLLQQIRDSAVLTGPLALDLTISIGAACATPLAALGADELIAAADACLYRAKRAGRDRIVLDAAVSGDTNTRAADAAN